MLSVTKTSHQLHLSAQSLVLLISNVDTGARELVVAAVYETKRMALQKSNIVSVLEYADEGIRRAIISVLEIVIVMTVVSATASVK